MDFNDDDFSDDESFEKMERQWKTHPLFKKAMEIAETSRVLAGTLTGHDKRMYEQPLQESSLILGAKFAGAYGSNNYTICMQNASIMRYHAQYLLTATSGLKMSGKTDKNYVKVLRTEVEELRELFKEWVSTFDAIEREEDEYVDEWGLFLRK